ncbi:AlpA family phage regulatory protein [Thalassotalea fonticola]|uniref:AlpA family phage regulatory protein n=1 Tax=Thalassotalea fonticola TaxID=3065649 RepID=A0ABZ0GP35_9GAMM|nr:AlpA family phage regulatory protein [Colwelliaceae bacterium S1-1]
MKTRTTVTNQLPNYGYLRITQILGDQNAIPPIPAIFPIGKSSWWLGIKQGRYPKPVKLGPNTTAWKVEDIKRLIDNINANKLSGFDEFEAPITDLDTSLFQASPAIKLNNVAETKENSHE